jgi:hypothetical protein
MVCGQPISPKYYIITGDALDPLSLGALQCVRELDGAAVHADADRGGALMDFSGSAEARIRRRLRAGSSWVTQLGARAAAAIGRGIPKQGLRDLVVPPAARALKKHVTVPAKRKALQRRQYYGCSALDLARWINVFYANQPFSASGSRFEKARQSGDHGTQMQWTRGGGCETAYVGHAALASGETQLV